MTTAADSNGNNAETAHEGPQAENGIEVESARVWVVQPECGGPPVVMGVGRTWRKALDDASPRLELGVVAGLATVARRLDGREPVVIHGVRLAPMLLRDLASAAPEIHASAPTVVADLILGDEEPIRATVPDVPVPSRGLTGPDWDARGNAEMPDRHWWQESSAVEGASAGPSTGLGAWVRAAVGAAWAAFLARLAPNR